MAQGVARIFFLRKAEYNARGFAQARGASDEVPATRRDEIGREAQSLVPRATESGV
jgi:hypothetical protein